MRWLFGFEPERVFSFMSRLALGLALVAFGHLVYVPGSLDPITFSTISDVITATILGIAAWRARDASEGIPRSILPILLALGPLELLDYGLSFGFGWFPFHYGFTLIFAGAIAISWGAWRLRRGDEGAKLVRIGAWLCAAGSLVYVVLASQPFLFGGASSVSFLVGATSALAGWALFGAAPSEGTLKSELPHSTP